LIYATGFEIGTLILIERHGLAISRPPPVRL